LFTLAEFLASGFLAGVLWIAFAREQRDKNVQWSKGMLASVITLASISTIVALVSFIGFFGAIFKKVGGIRTFARTIGFLLVIQTVISVLYIVAIYVEPKSAFIKQCENGSTDPNVVNFCTNRIQQIKGISVGIIVAALLLQAYELYVVSAYATELEQTKFGRNIILGNAKYTAVAGDDTRPLAGPNMSYPYADAGYGKKGGSYA